MSRNPTFEAVIEAIESGHVHLADIAEACDVTTNQARHQMMNLVDKGVLAYEPDQDWTGSRKPNKYRIVGEFTPDHRHIVIPPHHELMAAFYGLR